MLENFPKRKKSSFDEPIDRVLAHMKNTDLEDEEFAKLMTHLERFNRLRIEDKSRSKVSPDTMAIVVGNLVGLVIIVGFERNNIITSKGLGFILRAKN